MSATANVINGGNFFNPRSSEYYQNMFANQALISGDNSFMGIAPMGSAFGLPYAGGMMNSFSSPMMNNGSIFSNPYMMGNMEMGYGPGAETWRMSQKDYLRYMASIEDQQRTQEVLRQKKNRGAEFELSAGTDVISRRIAVLQEKIHTNDQDHILLEYSKLVESVKDSLASQGVTNLTDEKARAYAENSYAKATGVGIAQDIRANGDSSFIHGLKEGSFLGLGSYLTNEKSADKTISEITGAAQDKSDSKMRTFGQVLSGIATAGIGLFTVKNLVKLLRRGR